MQPFDLAAIVVTLAALFGYFNYRFIKLPTTIGVMLIAGMVSLALVIAGALGLGDAHRMAAYVVGAVAFDRALLDGLLSFLLFAGALHVDLEALSRQKWVIATLATVGLVTATALVAVLSRWIFALFGLDVGWIACLLLGALISPTDPIAVLGILKRAGVSHSLESKITGESLFNDGVAVVLFLLLVKIAGGHEVGAWGAVRLFATESVGGAVFGLGVGWLVFLMLRSIENYQVEVLLTLALVMGGYSAACALHLSGPIAMVVAGLLIGNHGRFLAMQPDTRRHLDDFWELLDEILNAVLFVLIGLEVLLIRMGTVQLAAGGLLVVAVLAARFVSVGLPISVMRVFRAFSPGAVRVMTWGGLRGGISMALALSLPASKWRDLLIAVTYVVVVFSILVQGMTIGWVVRRVSMQNSVEDGGEK